MRLSCFTVERFRGHWDNDPFFFFPLCFPTGLRRSIDGLHSVSFNEKYLRVSWVSRAALGIDGIIEAWTTPVLHSCTRVLQKAHSEERTELRVKYPGICWKKAHSDFWIMRVFMTLWRSGLSLICHHGFNEWSETQICMFVILNTNFKMWQQNWTKRGGNLRILIPSCGVFRSPLALPGAANGGRGWLLKTSPSLIFLVCSLPYDEDHVKYKEPKFTQTALHLFCLILQLCSLSWSIIDKLMQMHPWVCHICWISTFYGVNVDIIGCRDWQLRPKWIRWLRVVVAAPPTGFVITSIEAFCCPLRLEPID